jgi:hypothetical protein
LEFKRIIRSHDWWGSKLSTFLGVAYATVYVAGINLTQSISWILFILASLIVGASYVSIINDVTDIEQDVAAGKPNYMLKFPVYMQWILPCFCVAIGGVFMYFIYPDKLSLLLYAMSWVAFSLYSIPPIRLKTKGVLGVLADACGAHLFPNCLIISSLYFLTGKPVNWLWFVCVAVWAFSLGLRGILSHQFEDRGKDIVAGVTTFATKTQPDKFRIKARMIIIAELAAFIMMLLLIKSLIVSLFLLLYVATSFLRYKLYYTRLNIVTLDGNGNYRSLMYEYYQVFFPVSILIYISVQQPYGWLILLSHVAVFYKTIYLTFEGLFTREVLHRFIKKTGFGR